MDEEIALGVMYTDFSKAFRTVSHNTLTDKLMSQTVTETAKAGCAMAYQRMYRFEDKRLEYSPSERGLGCPVDGKLHGSQQCVLVA